MRICVYGAGVIGGLIASAHARAGHEVALIARGPHLDAVQARGLTVVTPTGDGVTTRHAASSDPRDFGPQDLVIVATKTPAFPEVAAHIAPLLGPETLVGFAVNGIFWFYGDGFAPPGMKIGMSPRLDPDGGAAASRDRCSRRALGYVCWAGGEIREPGTIHAKPCAGPRPGRRRRRAARGRRPAGEGDDQIGLGVSRTSRPRGRTTDIRTPMWRKYLGIAGNFATCALTGATIAQTHADAREVKTSRCYCG